MKVGIFYNYEQVSEEIAAGLAASIRRSGGQTLLFRRVEEIENVDRLVVLGGDGTMLRAACRCSETNIPILGVNYGTLGFLTEFEREDTALAARLVLQEDCVVEGRTMLQIELNGRVTHCLNELAVLRGVSPALNNCAAKISVVINGSSAGEFVGDGLIVATPTGSTAHSLSAGGSIMTPDCATFLLTPVCAVSMRSRPIAFSDGSTLTVHVPQETGVLEVYGDGAYLGKIGKEDVLTVCKSSRRATFLTRDRGGFFRRLTEKIN